LESRSLDRRSPCLKRYPLQCPEVSGANGQGETIEECFEDLQLAIQLIFEELREQAIAIYVNL
jgi:predicted RNase H-like HicB family nuclease